MYAKIEKFMLFLRYIFTWLDDNFEYLPVCRIWGHSEVPWGHFEGTLGSL